MSANLAQTWAPGGTKPRGSFGMCIFALVFVNVLGFSSELLGASFEFWGFSSDVLGFSFMIGFLTCTISIHVGDRRSDIEPDGSFSSHLSV